MEIKFVNTHSFTMKLFHYTSQVLHKYRKASNFSCTKSKTWNSYFHEITTTLLFQDL